MKRLLLLILLLPALVAAQQDKIKLVPIDSEASFRGLSVVSNAVIWMSGTRGTVCNSIDGGKTFKCIIIPGHDSADFRSVYAFDEKNVIICNAGSPAKVLRTADGGISWKELYSNENVSAFIDGIDFWNATEGIIHGDPIDGNMLLLTTNDAGHTWIEKPAENCPQMVEGEASFAASGTAIRCIGDNKIVIASGGVASRLFISDDKGNSWKWVSTPIIQGQSATGIFSVNFYDANKGIIVGGDYKNESSSVDNVFLTNDGGNNWQLPSKPTRGYRECVEYITATKLIATGPSGIDISLNGGLTWEPFSEEKKFHVIRKARNGNLVVICGANKQAGLLNY